jgi:hypothetical protein
MATILILAIAITLALGMLLVPAIGTIVFAQNMTGNETMMAGNLTSNMTGNMTGGMTGNMTP